MIRLESGGSDCTMEAGFRENSVYSAYTQTLSAVTNGVGCTCTFDRCIPPGSALSHYNINTDNLSASVYLRNAGVNDENLSRCCLETVDNITITGL